MSGMKDEVVYPEGADPQLINDDIAPLKEQKWVPTTSSPSGCQTCTPSAGTPPQAPCSPWD